MIYHNLPLKLTKLRWLSYIQVRRSHKNKVHDSGSEVAGYLELSEIKISA